jgi:long-chain acyl-CoA synthetase
VKGVPETIDLHRYQSTNDIASEAFKSFKDRPAFHNMGRSITYGQLDLMSTQFASFLQNQLNMKKGDRIALMMPNILQYPIALFGAHKAGLVVVNVNPLYTANELEFQLKDSGAEAIVIFANSAHLVERIKDKTDLKHVIVTRIGDLLDFPKNHIVNFVLKHVKKMEPTYQITGSYTFLQALFEGDSKAFQSVEMYADDLAFLQYTGGTTGVAKGAMLSHGNIVANVTQAGAWFHDTFSKGQEVIITPLPLYHIFSLTANCLYFSSMGGLNVLITNPRDLPGFIKELKKWKFTAFTGVNTLFNGLLNHEKFKEVDFSHLKLSLGGGMAVQKAVADRWKSVTKKTLLEAYGLTETSPAACINPINLEDFNGYIGLPISSTEAKIIDDEENELAIDEIGEICIRGPQVMKGYWQRPEETSKVMTKDGYFKTGDLGFMTEMGYIKLVDRKKDMILVSGFNVYPNEVEDVIALHPKVLEVAAIGEPDERSGEVVKVYIVPKDKTITASEVIKFAKEKLTGYKVPKYVEFRDHLPKTNVGKILRKDLRVK